jgi:hypothetical protein
MAKRKPEFPEYDQQQTEKDACWGCAYLLLAVLIVFVSLGHLAKWLATH